MGVNCPSMYFPVLIWVREREENSLPTPAVDSMDKNR